MSKAAALWTGLFFMLTTLALVSWGLSELIQAHGRKVQSAPFVWGLISSGWSLYFAIKALRQ